MVAIYPVWGRVLVSFLFSTLLEASQGSIQRISVDIIGRIRNAGMDSRRLGFITIHKVSDFGDVSVETNFPEMTWQSLKLASVIEKCAHPLPRVYAIFGSAIEQSAKVQDKTHQEKYDSCFLVLFLS